MGSPTGYEPEPSDVAALLADVLGDIPDEPDPLVRLSRLSSLSVLYSAVLSGIADERGLAAVELHDSGLSYARIAELLPASRSLAQQLVERGRGLTTVTLYESNGSAVYLAYRDEVWDFGPVTPDMYGGFTEEALAWIQGDWEPSEGDGQTPTTLDGLDPVATYRIRDGVRLLVEPWRIGGAARAYLGLEES